MEFVPSYLYFIEAGVIRGHLTLLTSSVSDEWNVIDWIYNTEGCIFMSKGVYNLHLFLFIYSSKCFHGRHSKAKETLITPPCANHAASAQLDIPHEEMSINYINNYMTIWYGKMTCRADDPSAVQLPCECGMPRSAQMAARIRLHTHNSALWPIRFLKAIFHILHSVPSSFVLWG